jgi:AraC-like DNA-binding protein
MPDANFRKLSDLRALLESFGAARAARRAATEPALMEGLHAVFSQLGRAARRGDCAGCREADARLHEFIMEMADVPGLAGAWKLVWEELTAFYQPRFDQDVAGWRRCIIEHEYLVETIRLGEPTAAEEAVRYHVEATWVSLSASLRQPVAAGGDPLYLATRHMAAHLQHPLRLDEVAARVAFTSPRHLSRLFFQRHGMGFKACLQKMRMAKAAELLAGTRLPGATIARRVGYHSLSLFARHFARHHGFSPRRWRQAESREEGGIMDAITDPFAQKWRQAGRRGRAGA